MATNFKGWFLKFGDKDPLPSRYILEGGWKTTPNQRMENDAYRDANGLLHRDTASQVKSKITVNIRPLSASDLAKFQSYISYTSKLERKCKVTYWNDSDLKYLTGTFYISDTDFTIKRVNADRTDVQYDSFELTLVEY